MPHETTWKTACPKTCTRVLVLLDGKLADLTQSLQEQGEEVSSLAAAIRKALLLVSRS